MSTFQESEREILRILPERYLASADFLTFPAGVENICDKDKFAFLSIGLEFVQDSKCPLYFLDPLETQSLVLYSSKSNPFREALNRLLVDWKYIHWNVEYVYKTPLCVLFSACAR